MKKFFVFSCCFAALIFIVSCGSDSKNDNTSSDTENPETTHDDSDSMYENQAEDPETTHDDSDSMYENQSELPECSTTSLTPCYDSSSKLIWSKKAGSETWQDAVDHCDNYSEGGLSAWRLPDIDELRTLLIWSNENLCKVSEKNNCLSKNCWSCETCVEKGQISEYMGCYSAAGEVGKYSKFGDTCMLWSSSSESLYGHSAWYVDFGEAIIHYSDYTDFFLYVRCVRNAE